MAINKTKQSLEDSLVKRVKDLEDQQIFLKTHPQPVGADILDVDSSFTSAGPITVAAGSALTLSITITPTTDFVLTLYNFEFTLYVDVFDSAHRYSGGASLSAGQRSLSLESWLDYEESDESTDFHRTYKIRMKNTDAVSHDYYINFLSIMPRLSLTL